MVTNGNSIYKLPRKSENGHNTVINASKEKNIENKAQQYLKNSRFKITKQIIRYRMTGHTKMKHMLIAGQDICTNVFYKEEPIHNNAIENPDQLN